MAYLPCTDGTRAVRVDPGGHISVLWHAPVATNGSPVVGGGAVWAVTYPGGTLYALDPGTGAVRQQIAIGKTPNFASPTLAGGRVLVGTATGVVAIRSG